MKEPKLFNQIIDKMIDLKEQENLLINGFIELLQFKLSIDKPSKKLQNWNLLDFGILLKELKKLKVRLRRWTGSGPIHPSNWSAATFTSGKGATPVTRR